MRRLDLARPNCADRIVDRESSKAWGFKDLDPHWLDPDIRRRASAP